MCIIVIMTDLIQKKEKLVMMMLITIIPPLESPHRGGANGGQIIKIDKNEEILFILVSFY